MDLLLLASSNGIDPYCRWTSPMISLACPSLICTPRPKCRPSDYPVICKENLLEQNSKSYRNAHWLPGCDPITIYLGVWNNLLLIVFIGNQNRPAVNSLPCSFNKRALQHSSTVTCMYIPSDFFFRVKSISSLLVDRVEDLVPRLEDLLVCKSWNSGTGGTCRQGPVDMVTFTNMVTLSSLMASPSVPCQEKTEQGLGHIVKQSILWENRSQSTCAQVNTESK